MQLLQICIVPTILIGRESWCLPYARFLVSKLVYKFVNGKVNELWEVGSINPNTSPPQQLSQLSMTLKDIFTNFSIKNVKYISSATTTKIHLSP